MKKHWLLGGALLLFVLLFAGCSLFPDAIEGTWTQVSVNGTKAVLSTVFTFTATTYTGSVAGVTANTGTWTKSGANDTLDSSFFGFLSTSTVITPVFSNWNNTLAYTDSAAYVEIYMK